MPQHARQPRILKWPSEKSTAGNCRPLAVLHLQDKVRRAALLRPDLVPEIANWWDELIADLEHCQLPRSGKFRP